MPIMSLYQWIKEQDREIAESLAGSDLYFSLSPTRLSLVKRLIPLAQTHLRGLCLDAGAGKMAYASAIRNWVERYVAMDLRPRPGLDAAGSVLEMPWRDRTFDSIFCTQVLEHVPEPERAIHEFYRCLKPGGILVMSVPHLAYLHNEPHDYFRFTRHGLRFLLERAGFSDINVAPAGGLLSFLGHIPSLIVKACFHPIPLVNRWVIHLNALYSQMVVWLDERVDSRKLFALNHIAVAKKPME